MGKFSKWLNLYFPSTRQYRQEADKMVKHVEELKVLAVDGDINWFIDRCREHKQEICDENDAPR